jgi:serpin B
VIHGLGHKLTLTPITGATKIGAEPGAVRSRPTDMISRRALLALLALTPLATATGCGSPSASGATLASADVPRSEPDPGAGADAVRAVTQFTSDLYRDVAGAVQGNLVCSPLSAAMALAMTVQGARGATADELLRALHASTAGRLAAGMNALDGALASRAGTYERPGDEPGEVALAVANSLWGQTGLAWEQAFLDVLAREFGTGMRQVDYRADPDGARSAINDWVDERTRERIPELVPEGAVHELTRLALVNAVYLKAPWTTPFDTSATAAGPFTRLDGSQVQTDLMHGSFPAEYAPAGRPRRCPTPTAGWR